MVDILAMLSSEFDFFRFVLIYLTCCLFKLRSNIYIIPVSLVIVISPSLCWPSTDIPPLTMYAMFVMQCSPQLNCQDICSCADERAICCVCIVLSLHISMLSSRCWCWGDLVCLRCQNEIWPSNECAQYETIICIRYDETCKTYSMCVRTWIIHYC